jgi:hypothetical protein
VVACWSLCLGCRGYSFRQFETRPTGNTDKDDTGVDRMDLALSISTEPLRSIQRIPLSFVSLAAGARFAPRTLDFQAATYCANHAVRTLIRWPHLSGAVVATGFGTRMLAMFCAHPAFSRSGPTASTSLSADRSGPDIALSQARTGVHPAAIRCAGAGREGPATASRHADGRLAALVTGRGTRLIGRRRNASSRRLEAGA